jgi:hypothetical protein
MRTVRGGQNLGIPPKVVCMERLDGTAGWPGNKSQEHYKRMAAPV